MPEAINAYDGPGYTGRGSSPVQKRDGVKRSHRGIVRAFTDMGNQALNAADYERTMHLPLGGGRLACDPETGDFDPDASRKPHNPATAPRFPRYVHSTITEGEHFLVETKAQQEDMLATRKWSDTPLEKKKKFTLTAEDQMVNLKLQIEGERAARRELELRLEAGAREVTAADPNTMLSIELGQEREARRALEARVEALLLRFETPPPTTQPVLNPLEEEELETELVTAGPGRKRR